MRESKKATTSASDLIWAAMEALTARHEGRITSGDIVASAADPSSPLHDLFNWDDEEAGHQYRLMQAGSLIRRWRGVIVKTDQKSKHVTVTTTRRAQSTDAMRKEDGGGYETIERIMSDPAKRDSLIGTVLRELSAYRRRYAEIAALTPVWAAIDEALELHEVEPVAVSEAERPRA